MPRTPQLTLPDLTGRRAVVTGGSDGIGLVIARRLAENGAEVVLPVRNLAKGERAVARIREGHPGARLVLHPMDLASLASVRSFAAGLVEDAAPVHLLINNAGLMTPPEHQRTVDGFEVQLGTNHIGHAALVAHLLPLLRAGSARVVSQTSVAARSAAPDWADPQSERSYDAMRAYRQSKLVQALFALELSRRSEAGGWGLSSVLVHPGVAPTSLLASRPEIGRSRDTVSVRVVRALSRIGLVGTAESAALPALMAATVAAPRDFYGPQGPGSAGGRPGPQPLWRPLRSEEDAATAWELTQQWAGIVWP
ncbi:SDR family oxidoreductase [Nocardioides sp.]|uniref:SDR family oxidoreductase n=1 Tax=Nocardioides sp. TaxID=35761 RepID=UPI0035185CD0